MEITLETFTNEYPNLMTLIFDKISPGDFGECRGIGRCGSCHINIPAHYENLIPRVGNGRNTLAKIESATSSSRLACQILINPSIHGLRVEIVDDEDRTLY